MARILVVDDDPQVCDVVRRSLERVGHQVLGAVDGVEGLKVCRESGAELALVDLHMPEMDGIELLGKLRALAPRLPVIAMSGGGVTKRVDLLDMALLLGATDTLAKPFTLAELFEAVSKALAASGAQPKAG